MFSTFDHVIGATTVRIRRIILQMLDRPDISVIDNNICIGGVTKIDRLAKCGINAILDLRMEKSDNINDLEKYNIDYLQVKIKDRSFPMHKDAITIIRWLRTCVNSNKKIFIHCNLGRGRATLATCLYMISNGIEPDMAVKTVKKNRKYMYLNTNQLNYLYDFDLNSNEFN